MKHEPHKPHIKTEDLISLYNQGKSSTQIGNEVGMCRSSVSRRLIKNGITLRKSDDYKGKNRYWLWKGDTYIDPIIRRYNQRQLRKWSKQVQLRDNYTCQDCGKTGVYLHAHHIVKIQECIDSKIEFDISNGITLCVKCHKHRHKEQGI